MRKLGVAAIAAIAVAAGGGLASSALARSGPIDHGCNSKQWGVGICWNPDVPLAPMHSCPNFTDRHMRNDNNYPRYDKWTGDYNGYVKVRSTVDCRFAHRVIVNTYGGWNPIGGWFWWAGYGRDSQWNGSNGAWLIRDEHVARTNEQAGTPGHPLPPNTPKPAPIYLEHDLVIVDVERLRDCKARDPHELRYQPNCRDLTAADYRGVRL